MLLRNCDLMEFMRRMKGKRIVCFGAGRWLEQICEHFPSYGLEKAYAYLVDNNSALWGEDKIINGKVFKIYPPQKLFDEADSETVVLISVARDMYKIYSQLETIPTLRNIECYCATFIFAEEIDRCSLEAVGPAQGWRMNQQIEIPKIIHYVWFGGAPIPVEFQKCIDSWKKYCPDYKIIEWNAENYDINKNRYMKEFYDNRKWGLAVDYARLDIVYEHGGIYMDVDVELIKNIDELLFNNAYMGFSEPTLVALGLGFGAVKNFKLIKELRDDYESIPPRLPDGSLNLKISPFYQTEVLCRHGLTCDGSFQVVDGAAVYPVRYLSGMNAKTKRILNSPDTFSIHHYAGTWENEQEKNKIYHMRQLFKSLKE